MKWYILHLNEPRILYLNTKFCFTLPQVDSKKIEKSCGKASTKPSSLKVKVDRIAQSFTAGNGGQTTPSLYLPALLSGQTKTACHPVKDTEQSTSQHLNSYKLFKTLYLEWFGVVSILFIIVWDCTEIPNPNFLTSATFWITAMYCLNYLNVYLFWILPFFNTNE